ncbi:hypothetical protein D3C73_654360 [compost metagenome]
MAPVVELEVVEFLGVVTGHQHDRVLLQALCAQVIQQRSNQAVGVMHRGVITVQFRRWIVLGAELEKIDGIGHRRSERRIAGWHVVRRVGGIEEHETEPRALRSLAGADVLLQSSDDGGITAVGGQFGRPLVQLVADIGERRAIEFRAVQRRAAIQMQVIALLSQHLEQLRATLLVEHAGPVATRQAVQQPEQTITGGVAGAEMMFVHPRGPGQLRHVGHELRGEHVMAQRLQHHHQYVRPLVALATQGLQWIVELGMARIGQADLVLADHAEAAHRTLGGDRLRPWQVIPLADHCAFAERVVVGSSDLAAAHQQGDHRPGLQYPPPQRCCGQQLPACPGQQSLRGEDRRHHGSRLQPGLPGQAHLILQGAAEHHVGDHRVEVEAIQREHLGIHQQQAQPQALADHSRHTQCARAARPQADGQRQQAGQRAEREQMAGQGNRQIGQAERPAGVVAQRHVAQRDERGQHRVGRDEQGPPGQPAPASGRAGKSGGGGVGQGGVHGEGGLGWGNGWRFPA